MKGNPFQPGQSRFSLIFHKIFLLILPFMIGLLLNYMKSLYEFSVPYFWLQCFYSILTRGDVYYRVSMIPNDRLCHKIYKWQYWQGILWFEIYLNYKDTHFKVGKYVVMILGTLKKNFPAVWTISINIIFTNAFFLFSQFCF